MQFGVMIVVITVIRDSAFSIVTDYAKGLWFESQEGEYMPLVSCYVQSDSAVRPTYLMDTGSKVATAGN
jgi:hypothetical protein